MSLLKAYFEDVLKIDQSLQIAIGDRSCDHVFQNTLTKQFQKAYKALLKRYDRKLQQTKRITTDDDILLWIVRDQQEGLRHEFRLLPITSLNNPILEFDFANKTMYPLQTNEDVDKLLSRYKDFVVYMDSMISCMREGMAKRMVIPKMICERLIQSLQQYVKTKQYTVTLRSKLKHRQKEVSLFFDTKYRDALDGLIRFLQQEYFPRCNTCIGLCDLPKGASMYSYLIKSYTTLDDVSASDIHAIGQREIRRIRSRLDEVKVQLGYSKQTPLKAFYKAIMTDPKNYYTTVNELMNAYTQMQERINNTVMKRNFHVNVSTCIIDKVPSYMENTSAGAFYNPPSVSGLHDRRVSKTGTFYINTRDLKENPKYDTFALSLHEGVPGHHYQFQYMIEQGVPLHRMYSMDGICMVEGWALYAESLGGEIASPIDELGMLTYEMFRAVRLVVDTGIHAFGWEFDRALSFMKKHVCMSESELRTEVERYICMPAQALCYKMGELCIKKWKAMWTSKYGTDEISIKNFHTAILEDGVVPMHVLEKKFASLTSF